MFHEIERFYEPISVLDTIDNNGYTGMSVNDLGFLCGCIKKFKPKKIVEVGVSAGGTTAVIMECCRILGINPEIYSVDISTRWYVDTNKATGYVVNELKEREEFKNINHTFLLGATLGSMIEKIGQSIDFIIMDTMHSLPGELLDFISAANWLSERAVVVFHDVGQCQLGIESMKGKPFEYASLITFSCLCGEKYWNRDKLNYFNLSNIAAISLKENFINDIDNIDNLFAALFVNWDYIPDKQSLNEYRVRIEKDYGKKYLQIFEQSLESNVYSLYKRGGLHIPINKVKQEFDTIIENASEIYVYGAGHIGSRVRKYIEAKNKKIAGYVTSYGGGCSISIKEFQQLQNDNAIIVLGLCEEYHWDVFQLIVEYNLEKSIYPNYGIGFRELMTVIDQELDGLDIYNNNIYEHNIVLAAKRY